MPSRSKPTGLQSRPDAVAAISVAVAGMQQPAPLSASGFEAIAKFLRRHAGIELNQDKHSLVQSRLRKHVVGIGTERWVNRVEPQLAAAFEMRGHLLGAKIQLLQRMVLYLDT